MTGLLRETAYAKLNLALHIRARRSDGYHDIETLFAFCEHGDDLTVEPGEGLSLTMSGPFANGLSSGNDNLVLRAASALQGKREARLHLTKNLPVASGIGGGSADAGAALRLLNRFWSLDLPNEALREIAAKLGADVPACVESQTAMGHGRGDALVPALSGFEGAPVLLVNPGMAVSTAPVFAAWEGQDHGALDPADTSGWRNDLMKPAILIAPAIAEILEKLGALTGVIMARMSGSGATCFAVFEDDRSRDAAAAGFDCWTLATSLRSR